MNKVTHIEKTRQQNAVTKLEVQNLLGWDDLRYAEYQEEMGREYIRQLFGEGTAMVDDIPNHREFWAWWKLHWAKRDREFVELAGMLFLHERESYYTDLHNPAGVAFRPHAPILMATYEAMMHRLVKEAVR